VIELNYAGFVIDVYMCELVFVNHVNICGRVHELTPKNGTNLSNFELTKNLPRLNQIPTPPERCSTDFVTSLARLLLESRHVTWRDSFLSHAKTPGATQEGVAPVLFQHQCWRRSYGLQESRQATWRDSRRSRAMRLGATQEGVAPMKLQN
jgi:hypothetical protein